MVDLKIEEFMCFFISFEMMIILCRLPLSDCRFISAKIASLIGHLAMIHLIFIFFTILIRANQLVCGKA